MRLRLERNGLKSRERRLLLVMQIRSSLHGARPEEGTQRAATVTDAREHAAAAPLEERRER